MATSPKKRLSEKQVLEGVAKMMASLEDTEKDARENREKQMSLAKKHFGDRFSDQGETTAKYVEELSDHFRQEMTIIESELATGADRLRSDRKGLQTAHNFIKRAEMDIDRLDVKKTDYTIGPDDEALIQKLKALLVKNPSFLPALLEGEPGTDDYITEVKDQYDKIKVQLDSAKEMISTSRTQITERIMVKLQTDVLPTIQKKLDEGQRFAQEEAEAFSELRNAYNLERARLEEEIKSLRESKEQTEATLADHRERSTTKQQADRTEIEQLQAAIKRQHKDMETTKRENEGAMRGERDLHNLAMERTRREHVQAMERTRREHVQAMDAARVESDQLLSDSREEHTKLEDKAQEERTQAINQVRLEHDQAMSEAYREHVQAMEAAQTESDRRVRQSREDHAQAMDTIRTEHAQALSKAQEEYAQVMANTRAEHAQTLENAETRSATKSKIIASNVSVLHRSDADAEERINELCELFEGMQSTATQQLTPDLFPDNRRLDSTNTVMEEGLTLVAGDSGALFLFDKHSGIYMFRAEDLDYVSVATYKLMLIFRGDLCLPERLRSITLWEGVAETLDFVLDWKVEYLKGVVSKFED